MDAYQAPNGDQHCCWIGALLCLHCALFLNLNTQPDTWYWFSGYLISNMWTYSSETKYTLVHLYKNLIFLKSLSLSLSIWKFLP